MRWTYSKSKIQPATTSPRVPVLSRFSKSSYVRKIVAADTPDFLFRIYDEAISACFVEEIV